MCIQHGARLCHLHYLAELEKSASSNGNITGQANADQTHVRVDQLNFAAQNKHRQALLHQARKSADTISWTASALFQTRKEASKRPLGEHSPARRTCASSRCRISLVS